MFRFSDAKCTNERLGRQLFRLSILPTGSSSLPQELQAHLNECSYCGSNFADWKKKGYFAARIVEAQKIVQQGDTGDQGVIVKQIGARKAYFRATPIGKTSGVLVVTGEDGKIVEIDD